MSSKQTGWAKRIEAWQASGQSAAAFCRSRGLAYSQFVYWQRVLGASALRDDGAALVPVVVVDAEAAPSSPMAVELDLPHGIRLRLASTSVADVITLVRGLSC